MFKFILWTPPLSFLPYTHLHYSLHTYIRVYGLSIRKMFEKVQDKSLISQNYIQNKFRTRPEKFPHTFGKESVRVRKKQAYFIVFFTKCSTFVILLKAIKIFYKEALCFILPTVNREKILRKGRVAYRLPTPIGVGCRACITLFFEALLTSLQSKCDVIRTSRFLFPITILHWGL